MNGFDRQVEAINLHDYCSTNRFGKEVSDFTIKGDVEVAIKSNLKRPGLIIERAIPCRFHEHQKTRISIIVEGYKSIVTSLMDAS